jgi:uncharacterized protein (AIM24 family)
MAVFEVVEQQGLKMIKATINNETIRAEAGALHYMLGGITLETKMPTAGGFLKSMVTQETLFRPTYTGTGEIFFGPPIFGEYMVLPMNNEEWVLDKGAYVCSDGNVEVGVWKNKLASGLLSGEGMFQTRVAGTGNVVIQAPGPMQVVDLVNNRLAVDGSFAVARQAHLNFSVQKASKGLLSSMASGEGFLNIIEGSGRVYLAPVPNVYHSVISRIGDMIMAIPRGK